MRQLHLWKNEDKFEVMNLNHPGWKPFLREVEYIHSIKGCSNSLEYTRKILENDYKNINIELTLKFIEHDLDIHSDCALNDYSMEYYYS